MNNDSLPSACSQFYFLYSLQLVMCCGSLTALASRSRTFLTHLWRDKGHGVGLHRVAVGEFLLLKGFLTGILRFKLHLASTALVFGIIRGFFAHLVSLRLIPIWFSVDGPSRREALWRQLSLAPIMHRTTLMWVCIPISLCQFICPRNTSLSLLL